MADHIISGDNHNQTNIESKDILKDETYKDL